MILKSADLTEEQREKVAGKYQLFKDLSQSSPGICSENNPNKKVTNFRPLTCYLNT